MVLGLHNQKAVNPSTPALVKQPSSDFINRPLLIGGTVPLLARTDSPGVPGIEGALPRVQIELSLPPGAHAGLTLQSRGNRGCGCKVSAAVTRDQAYKCGLRVGDVLLEINGEPINSPADGTRLINNLTQPNDPTRPHAATTQRAMLTVIQKVDSGYEPPPLLRKQSSTTLSAGMAARAAASA